MSLVIARQDTSEYGVHRFCETPPKHRFYKTIPNKIMLDFFLYTLDVRIKLISNVSMHNSSYEDKELIYEIQNKRYELQKQIQNKFDEIQTRMFPHADDGWGDLWNDAYRLQTLLAIVEPPESLFPALERITDKSLAEHIPGADRLKKNLCQAEKDLMDSPAASSAPRKIKDGAETRIRMFLLDALEQYNRSRQTKFLARSFQKQATNRMVFAGLVAFVLFVLPYLYLTVYFRLIQQPIALPWLPGYSVMASGLFGAFFSRLISLQTTVRSLRSCSFGAIANARCWRNILVRGITGMSGAVIVCFFLRSGFIAGSVFPDFVDLGITQYTVLPTKGLALLVVWSFLAGFSERLVPNILASTEKKFTDATQ
ncbi:MAG: hypothetical protein ACREC0_05795 [Methylocella sp.]